MAPPFSATVEVAFTTVPDDPSPVWVDISAWVTSAPSVTRGRGDSFSQVQTSQLSFVVDNSDGRFTPDYAAGAYYPNVKLSRRVRVSVVSGATYRRFDGYVDAWPTQWAAVGTYATGTVTATCRLKRMGAQRVLTDLIGLEYATDVPIAYYPMGESEGATSAGNASTTPQPSLAVAQLGTGGTITFGAGTGPPTDGLSAPIFARSNASNGKYLSATLPTSITADVPGIGFGCFINTAITSAMIMSIIDTSDGDPASWDLRVSSTGKLQVRGAVAGVAFDSASSAVNIDDGLTHHVFATVSGGTSFPYAVTLSAYLDGALVATVATFAASTHAGRFTKIQLGCNGQPASEALSGTVAQAAVFAPIPSAARIAIYFAAGLTGFAGERSDQRVTRLAVYGGVAAGDITIAENGLSTMAAQDTTGKTSLALIQEVMDTEGGLVVMTGLGKLLFQGRAHRYNQAVAFTLAAGQYGPEVGLVLDDFGVLNDLTVSREGGTTARAVNATSITEYGVYAEARTLITTSDAEVVDTAQWVVNNYGLPLARWPSIPVDMYAQLGALAATVLGSEVGDRFTLTGLPSTAPASSVSLNIEGYTETFGLDEYTITINASPAAQSQAWVLEDTTNGVLDTTTRLAY